MATAEMRTVIHGEGISFSSTPKELELQAVHSLALIKNCRGLQLNGVRHGSGSRGEELFFDEEEFINLVGLEFIEDEQDFRNGFLGAWKIETNLGRSLQCGDFTGSSKIIEHKDIRVMAISTKTDISRGIAQVGLQLIDDFEAPTELPPSEEGLAVIEVRPQFTTIQTVSSSETSVLSAETRMIEEQFAASVSTKAKAKARIGPRFARATFSASVSASIKSKGSDTKKFQTELSESQKKTNSFTQEVPEGYVGLQLVKVKIYEESDGFKWMYPISEPQYLTIAVDADLPDNVYDLTGTLALQLPAVRSRVEEKNGFTYIQNAPNVETQENEISNASSRIGMSHLMIMFSLLRMIML